MKAFRVEDLYRHRTLQSLQGSPAHTRVVFVRSQPSRVSDTYRSAAWQLDTADGPDQARRLTARGFNAGSPRLSPDGTRLAFLSRRDKSGRQIHLLSLAGGEAQPLTDSKFTIENIDGWSADGSRVLFSASVPLSEDERDDASRPEKDRPIVAAHLPYKMDGSGPSVGRRTHLFRVDVQTGEQVQLTRGDFNVKQARWSPDGQCLAFVRTREGRQRHLVDLWLADADGRHAREASTGLSAITGPEWSPDGRRLVFGGNPTAGDSIDRPYAFDVESAELAMLADDVHLEDSRFVWHPDGSRIATVVVRKGMHEIAVLDARGGARHFPRRLRHVMEIAASGDALVLTAASMRRPEELFRCDWEGDGRRRLTSFNAWVRKRQRPRVTVRAFPVPDGDGGTGQVDAWILRPAGDGPFPVLVDMHGGPQSSVLIDYPSHAYWYALCAQGWMVLAPNTVGSAGYGDDFAKRLIGRWGELDLPQHLAILEQLRKEALIDDRVACTGKSYGGFLSAWAIGNSDVFRAAAICAPVANVESHTGTSDTGFYVTPYAMDGEMDRVRGRYHRLSPIEYCRNADAAVLLLQGQDDQRCPVGQSEEMFANLVRCSGQPVQMVVYPGGSHSLAGTGKPAHRVDWHQRIVDWVTCHAGTPVADRARDRRSDERDIADTNEGIRQEA